MIKIKLKYIIILLLILFLSALCYYKYNKIEVMENFNVEKTMKDIEIVLSHQKRCPITYQFMYGCCEGLANDNDLEMYTT